MTDDERDGQRVRGPADDGFLAGLLQDEVRFLRCEACGGALPYGARLCPACGSARLAWAASAGRGVLRACAIYHRAYDDGRAVPYAVSIVELDEGPRLLAPLDLPDPGALRPGARVAAKVASGLLSFGPAGDD